MASCVVAWFSTEYHMTSRVFAWFTTEYHMASCVLCCVANRQSYDIQTNQGPLSVQTLASPTVCPDITHATVCPDNTDLQYTHCALLLACPHLTSMQCSARCPGNQPKDPCMTCHSCGNCLGVRLRCANQWLGGGGGGRGGLVSFI